MCLEGGELEEAERFLDAPAVECDLCHDSVRAEGGMFLSKKPAELQIMSGGIWTSYSGLPYHIFILGFFGGRGWVFFSFNVLLQDRVGSVKLSCAHTHSYFLLHGLSLDLLLSHENK